MGSRPQGCQTLEQHWVFIFLCIGLIYENTLFVLLLAGRIQEMNEKEKKTQLQGFFNRTWKQKHCMYLYSFQVD